MQQNEYTHTHFHNLCKISKMLPFSEKIADFHPSKFLMTFVLVINRKFQISPYFPGFSTMYIPACFAKISISPCFHKYHLFSKNSPAFYILFVYLVFPYMYFDHDAFMHHPMHVLDVPVCASAVTKS